jgi:Ca2+:H+ antiporter
MTHHLARLRTTWMFVVPPVGVGSLALAWTRSPGAATLAVLALLLGLAVLAAVHHAEVVAARVGEPFGSLVLAVCVTVIEVALILTLMLSAGTDGSSSLARDTVFAAVMITCNGVLVLSILVGSIRSGVVAFNAEGMAAAFMTVATLATLSLVLPTFTTSEPGQLFSPLQLAFAATASLVLYLLYVFVQTVRHRDYFLPADDGVAHHLDEHAERPNARQTRWSFGMLVLALVAVVGLAKVESPAIEELVGELGAPESAVGVVVALLVLLPESLAAYRNARVGRVQTSFNLALGSAMASIGLTIPVIAISSIWLDTDLVLGLDTTQVVLLGITVVAGAFTVLPGRATVLSGGVHLALCAAFLVLAVSP